MKFCTRCGSQANDNETVCMNCGCQLEAPVNISANNQLVKVDNTPNTEMIVVGLLVPVVGLILSLIWKEQTPEKSKALKKGAIIGFGVHALLSILYTVFLYTI